MGRDTNHLLQDIKLLSFLFLNKRAVDIKENRKNICGRQQGKVPKLFSLKKKKHFPERLLSILSFFRGDFLAWGVWALLLHSHQWPFPTACCWAPAAVPAIFFLNIYI